MEKSLFICSTKLVSCVSNYPSGLGAVVFVLCLGLILSIVWLSCGCPSGPATVPEIATILGSPRTLCVIGTDCCVSPNNSCYYRPQVTNLHTQTHTHNSHMQ
ncbi:hypothetical protein ILYODFUR_032290 [Ilyodon furcidens]|uniref:Uncharacterized protein n=1 Tax=Ilyodon furcidens TaxID=33524 RepID=A0ABV0TFB2_9TELE